MPKITVFDLKGDGDFRSDESMELLKQADIVVTNPPFSLFREYVAQLIEHEKKFLVVGNMNAITYKEIFPLIKQDKLWFGPSISSGDRKFGVPDHYPLNAASSGIDEDGQRFVKVKGVRWYTNLDHRKRHEELILYRSYTPEDYPRYDNYNAIEVGKTRDIPMDWGGVMGVPITFLDKYNPEQFEIVGMDRPLITKLTGKVSRFRIKGSLLQYYVGMSWKNGFSHVRCRQWKGKFKGLRPVFAISGPFRADSPDSGHASPAPGVRTPEKTVENAKITACSAATGRSPGPKCRT